MVQPTPSALCDDLVARIRVGAPRLEGRVTYGPPEGAPTQLMAWLDYGPVEFAWGLMEVSQPQVVITVAVPRKSNYPSEYRTVTDVAQQVHHSLRGDVIVADEATIAGMSIERAGGMLFAGADIVAVRITLTLEMKQQNVAAAD